MHDTVMLSGTILRDTPAAVLFRVESGALAWLPRALCAIERDSSTPPSPARIGLVRCHALERGLLNAASIAQHSLF